MILLDVRTIIFSNTVTDIVCILVILFLWHQSRKRFAGTGFWVFDFAFQTAAMFLIILRGSIPDWMSMVLSNTLVIAGAILGYMGLGYFVGKKISQVHNCVLLAAFACVHAYFTFVQPSLAARTLNISAGLLIICFQCMCLLVYRVEPGVRRLTLGVGMVFGAYCLVSVVRIVGFFTGTPAANNFFHSGAFESLMLISYQMLFILLTYSLALMVNKRLLVEVETQEEKFAKAFHSSPYAITLTRLSDGQIVEVNDGFVNITGYPRTEVMGKTTIDLHLWNGEEDRAAVADELSKSGKVQGREFQFRKKSGERITGLFSADIIPINDQECILSSMNDITERKRAEEALRQSEQRWATTLASIGDGVIATDVNGRTTFMNAVAEGLTGWALREALQKPVTKVFNVINEHTHKEVDNPVSKVLQEGKVIGLANHTVLIRKDGTEAAIDDSGAPIKDERGNVSGVVLVFRDITERKRAEEELRKAYDELEKRVQERTSDLSGAIERLRIENTQRKELEDILREKENQVRFFASQCLTAQETERKRVAGELHDSIAAALAAMKFRIDKIADEMKQGRGGLESLQDLGSKVTELNNEVRRIMADLRPSILDDLGIIPAMNWFCREYQKTYSHICVENRIAVSEEEVPDSLKTPIFRNSQEALNNIAKHSKATLVNLALRKEDDKILLIIQDNGQGFNLETVRKGLGLSTMRERVELSGGSFDLESTIGKGTLICVSWPV